MLNLIFLQEDDVLSEQAAEQDKLPQLKKKDKPTPAKHVCKCGGKCGQNCKCRLAAERAARQRA